MKRNVLLTTMSTLPPSRDVHYYCDEKTSRYCEGLLQTEAGTKFILCGDEKIDDIVVIGSDETYKKTTEDNPGDIIRKVKLVDFCSSSRTNSSTELSAYDFYRKRIGEFCIKGDSRFPYGEIEESRAAELRAIADNLMIRNGYTNKSEWFDNIAVEERRNKKDIRKGLIGELNAAGLDRGEKSYIESYYFSLLPDSNRMILKHDMSDLSIQFIPERITTEDGKVHDNIVDILAAIKDKDDDEVNLFVDMQGGGRTDGFVRNAILTILAGEADSKFNLSKVVATNFSTSYFSNAIVDETDRYMITELVSGMNAFTQYGKADLIKKYCDRMYRDENHIQRLVTEMLKIDKALSICDVDSFSKALVAAHEFFENSSEDPVFSLMEKQIKEEYRGILDHTYNIDYVRMTNWAIDKSFIQQALTIAEAKFPRLIVENGICFYDTNKAAEYFISKAKGKMTPAWQFDDLAHLYIKRIAYGHDSKKAGKKTYASEGQVKALLDDYRDLCEKRNRAAHSQGNKSDNIETTYAEHTELLKSFLNHYTEALKESCAGKHGEKVHIYTKEDLKLETYLKQRKQGNKEKREKTSTTNTKAITEKPPKKPFKSVFPNDASKCYQAVVLAHITPKQVKKICLETGCFYDEDFFYVYGKTQFKKIKEYYMNPDNKEQKKEFINAVRDSVAEIKAKNNKPSVLIIDENFYTICTKDALESILKDTYGHFIIGRGTQQEWHVIEKMK